MTPADVIVGALLLLAAAACARGYQVVCRRKYRDRTIIAYRDWLRRSRGGVL